jgi:tryptophan 2,3-dioxygenase
MTRLLPYLRLPEGCEPVAHRQRARGRLALDDSARAQLAALHRSTSVGTGPANEVLGLLTRPFTTDEVPEYYRYTSLHVLGWFLDRHDGEPLAGVVLGLHALLTDLLRVETEQGQDVPADRIARLRTLVEQVSDLPLDRHRNGKAALERADRDEQLRHRAFLLARCSGFIISDKHDEHIFLRCVQACELVFYANRWLALQSILALRTDRSEALFRIRQLGEWAEMLNRLFHLLQTLSPEQFMGFRDATGAASAVMSLNYHTMELVVYGYDRRKGDVYRRFPHLRRLAEPAFREFRPLGAVVAARGDEELGTAYAAVDRVLLTWRGRHYSFARRYLADIKGSGGTEGAAYLKRHMRKVDCWPGGEVIDPVEALARFAHC